MTKHYKHYKIPRGFIRRGSELVLKDITFDPRENTEEVRELRKNGLGTMRPYAHFATYEVS
jgi:hypothetical protein